MEKNRDLERTRARILKAALAEFAAKGLGGARCEDIARRARVNKRMLFYCFRSKKNLYREILRRKFSQRAQFFESAPDDLGSAILHWYDAFSSDMDLVRLLEWEALGSGRGQLTGETERREYLKRTVSRLRRAQDRGMISPELDLVQLQISIIALTAFPLAFPQMTRLASGLLPTDPRFRRKRMRFLRYLGERLSSNRILPGAGRESAIDGTTAPGQKPPAAMDDNFEL
jgi:TetR/AcrR family transcriptional regulator